MLFLLSFFFAVFAEFDFNFTVGEQYKFVFNSNSFLSFTNVLSVGKEKGQNISLTTLASIYCKNVVDNGYNFELTLSDVRIVEQDFEGKVILDDRSEELQKKFGKYFIFVLRSDGSIGDVFAAADEDDSVVSIKSGIIGQFILDDETADNQGLYRASFEKTKKDNSITFSRTYTEKNFISFHDQNVKDVAVESTEIKVIQNNLPFSVDAASVLHVSGEKAKAGYSGSTLSSNSSISLKFSSSEKGIPHFYDGKLKAITFFDPDFYLNRRQFEALPKKFLQKNNLVRDTNCPNASLDLCEGYSNSWTWGNSDFAATAGISALAGVNNQCPAPTRNFVAAASAAAGLTVLGNDIEIGNLSVGYGYVDGVAQQNGVSFVLANNVSLFNWTIPDVLCNAGTYDLGLYQLPIQTLSYTYYLLGEFPITFEIGGNLTISAEVDWGYCDANTSASVKIVSSVSAVAFGGISVDFVVARGGVRLEVQDVEVVDPTVAVDGAKCALDLSADLTTDVSVDFVGWYQYWDWIKWSDVKNIPIYQGTVYHNDLNLFDYEWTLPTSKMTTE